MSNLTLEEMSTTYYDVLKEIGNIGAGNATTALASLLQSKVDMKVPNVMMLDFKDVGNLLGGEEQELVAAYLGVEGDITGSILFLIQKETAMMMAKKLLGDYCGEELGEMERSAVKEVSNITSIPIVAISVDEKFKNDFKDNAYDNKPVRYLTRLMPKALW